MPTCPRLRGRDSLHSKTKPVLLSVVEHVQPLGSDGLMALQKPLVSIDEPLGGLSECGEWVWGEWVCPEFGQWEWW